MSKENKNKYNLLQLLQVASRVIAREFMKDRLALTSLIILVTVLLAVFIGALLLDQEQVMKVNLWDVTWNQVLTAISWGQMKVVKISLVS